MFHHFVNCFFRSKDAFIASLGSTTLGFVAPFLVPIVGFTLALFVFWLREGKLHVMAHLRRTLTLACLIGIGAELLVYGTLFMLSIVRTIYNDHESLVSQKNSVPKLPQRNTPATNIHIVGFNLLSTPLFEPNKPIRINVQLYNSGPFIAQDVQWAAAMHVEMGAMTKGLQDAMYAVFKRSIPATGTEIRDFQVGQGEFRTLVSRTVTPEYSRALRSGSLVIVIMGYVKFEDQNGVFEVTTVRLNFMLCAQAL